MCELVKGIVGEIGDLSLHMIPYVYAERTQHTN